MKRNSAALAAAVALAAGVLLAASGDNGSRWWSYVEYLASDQMQGRQTGSPEHRKAAEYVAAQFQRDGLKPAGESGGYIQPVRFKTLEIDESHSSLTLVRGGARKKVAL